MYELLSGLLLALGGSVITLGIQRIIRCVNRPILEASIVYGNDNGGAGRVLRIKNKGKSVMDGLSVEVDLGYDDYGCEDIVKKGSINPKSFMDIFIGI